MYWKRRRYNTRLACHKTQMNPRPFNYIFITFLWFCFMFSHIFHYFLLYLFRFVLCLRIYFFTFHMCIGLSNCDWIFGFILVIHYANCSSFTYNQITLHLHIISLLYIVKMLTILFLYVVNVLSLFLYQI